MKKYVRSLGYALEGLRHAFITERNFKLFVLLYLLSLFLGWILQIYWRDWEVIIFTGGVFLAFELVNTALEHLSNAFDTHSKSIHRPAIKATKDIAAAGSLLCAVSWGVILAITFIPHLQMMMGW